jgi:hypothetical protein
MTLAILVPSRGRPHNLARLAHAVSLTATTPYHIWARLDDDDVEYPDISNVTHIRGPRVRFAASTNELAALAVADGATHLALFGDDVVPESRGWDSALIEALGGRMGVAFGSDGLEHLHGADLPTHVVVPAEMFVRLGWVTLPTIRHLFCDNVWRELGKGVGNFQYVPEASLRHYHRWNKTAPDDKTYREANDKHEREKDRRTFEEWRDGPGLAEAVALLRDAA